MIVFVLTLGEYSGSYVAEFERQLLDFLAVDDPWCHSREGLDDPCHFCGSETVAWLTPPGRPQWDHVLHYRHFDGCPWIFARLYLGKPLGEHYVTKTLPAWLADKLPEPWGR